MKQVINQRGTVLVQDVPEPACGPGEVKIALTYSLISTGTEISNVAIAGQSLASRAKERPDLVKKVMGRARQQGIMAAYRAVKDKLYEPKPLGYSATGVVLEVGALVTGFAPGDRVACGGATAAHAAIVSVPENLVVRVPEGLEPAHGAFATVGCIALQGIRRGTPELGDTFVILGLGLIGQLCVQFAKVAGARVIGFDMVPERVAMAKELGADAAYVMSEVDPVERVADFTHGVGADCVVVAAATKSSDPVNTAAMMVRERGRVSVVGAVGLDLQRGPFYMKEMDLFMSRSYGPGRYDNNYEVRGLDYPIGFVRWTENRNMAEVLRLIAEGHVQVAPLVSNIRGIDEAPDAYASLQSGEGVKPLAVLLQYQEMAPTARPKAPTAQSRRDRFAKPVRVALIGCGAFAKLERLPYLTKMNEFRLEMLVSVPGAQVKQLASEYGVKKYASDYHEALADPDVDLLVVATPHSLHAPIAIDAAAAGKAVLVEKPMAVNAEELEEVYAQLQKAGVSYAVGFNRRFAPASQALKAFVERSSEPCHVICRANPGLVPPGSWMHAPEEGGGRIVGDGVHFYDYCNWLIGSRPVSVASTTISYEGDRFVGSDNLSSVIKYADGSTATVIYTTLGNASLTKERIEVFSGGAAAVIDDFESLTFFGAKQAGWTGTQDKGHRNLMKAVADGLIEKGEMPIGLEASYLGHRLMFQAMAAARTGQVLTI